MDTTQSPQFTVTEREGNPKAVFFGDQLDLVHQLAHQLSEHGVDLFSGKTLSDAFFGDYFFYVGELAPVKDFLVTSGKDLPKTLLLLRRVSDYTEVEKLLGRLPHLKAVTIGEEIELTAPRAERVMEFFFTASDQLLKLGKLAVGASIELPTATTDPTLGRGSNSDIPETTSSFATKAPATQIAPSQQDKKPQEPAPISPPTEVQPDALSEQAKSEQAIPAELTKPASTQTAVTRQLVGLFDQDNPKPTGRTGGTDRLKRRIPFHKALVLSLVFFLLAPVVILVGEIGLTGFHIWAGGRSFNSANYKTAAGHFKTANFYASASKKQLAMSEPLFSLVHKRAAIQQLVQLATIVDKSTLAAHYGGLVADDAAQLARGVTGTDKGVLFAQLLSNMKGNLTLADSELAGVQAEYKTETFQNLLEARPFSRFREKLSGLFVAIDASRRNLMQARMSLSMAPEVLGLYGERTYLLLFQNNMELRPTGGFIGSYGLLTFINGELKEFTVEDIYVADGALKGHVDPPPAIQKHLGQEHWYLRDSNWDPDFTETASRAEWFLEKELGLSVDGVLGIDVSFLESLLGVLGEIELKDYGETLTAENLFVKTQDKAQTDFFPGSTQKRDFLGAVARQLIDKLLQDDKAVSVPIVRAVQNGLEERHLQMYFNSPALLEVVDVLGWGGRLVSQQLCVVEACFNDFLAVVDANLGVNKTDYYVTRKVEDEIRLGDSGLVTHHLQLEYENQAQLEDQTLGGFYKNYVRVFVPSGAQLQRASLDDEPLETTAEEVASQSALLVNDSPQLLSFEHLIEVPPQAKRTLSLTYELTATPAAALAQSYRLSIRKQAGLIAPNYAFTITVPDNWTLVSRTPENEGEVAGTSSLENEAQISYNSDLRQDQLIELNFRQ